MSALRYKRIICSRFRAGRKYLKTLTRTKIKARFRLNICFYFHKQLALFAVELLILYLYSLLPSSGQKYWCDDISSL